MLDRAYYDQYPPKSSGKGIDIDETDNAIYTAIAISQKLVNTRFKKKLTYLSENDEKTAQETPTPPLPRPDEDAMRSELKSLRQTAVSLTVGEKEGASALIKEWLEDNPDQQDENTEESEGE